MNRLLPGFAALWLSLSLCHTSYAAEAFGQPGAQANWASAKKMQVGTFNEKKKKSLVWFTSAKGILTEVFYPTIDTGQIKDSQFLITDGKTFFHEEKKDLKHQVNVKSPSNVEMVNSDKEGRYNISHTFFTLRDASILVEEVVVETFQDGLSFYLLTNPHLNNTGSGDSAFIDLNSFLVKDGATTLRIQSTIGFSDMSVGFVGSSDGWNDLNDNFKMDHHFTTATKGNVATFGKMNIIPKAGKTKFWIVYTMTGEKDLLDNTAAILPDYQGGKADYINSWDNYLNQKKTPSGLSAVEKSLYKRSLYTLKVHEDKLNPGALIASLSIPWGEKQMETPGQKIGGYHLIWPRDLYHVALAMLYSGELESPMNALRFLKKIQYTGNSGHWDLSPRFIPKSGAFPQNTWVTGEDYWGGLQLDQAGYPIHLFYQVFKRVPLETQQKMITEFGGMIRNALTFILRYGPWTQQERWEENFGISPSSFSVATSALKIGAELFKGIPLGNWCQKTSHDWLNKPGDNIDSWTFTTNGQYGDGKYYLRIAGGSSFGSIWDPNDRSDTHIANSSRREEQSRILDQGFLKLVLLGLKPGSDPKVKKSKNLLDQHISVQTPRGRGWYRYSFDAYGEEGQGRLWPLLSSEHGRYAIERYRSGDLTWAQANREVQARIDSYIGFSNSGQMIPEQVFEKNGEGTGGATPLAWSHAEYLKLIWSRDLKQNIENPFN
ncbi:MAG: hypothetical protein HN509_14860 [Halobacteriovoraceae bacterium]|jgi:glucoamylase|nr:hypothetical protein [Halobacteriovoraceae bacterium]MBT5095084.1 hypothetical protein [Halobacteriovoraceae bacterium]